MTKVHLVKAMVFLVVTYGCESWIIKKAEHQRIDAFELWCWRRLLRPLESLCSVNPKGNQPWIFTGRTDAEAEAPILWPLMWKANSLEKTLMLRKADGRRRRGQQRVRWLDEHEFVQTLGDSEGQGSLACWSPQGCKESDTTEPLNWT